MNGFEQMARLQAALMNGRSMSLKVGVVTSYDPDKYQAKVALQPNGILTGWLPVASQWVGSGWGLFMPPSGGQHVLVVFLEGNINAGVILGNLFSATFPPISVPAGEMLVQHQAGSLLHFHNDGTVALVSKGTLTSSAPQWNHTGAVQITGNLTVDGDEDVSGTVKAPTVEGTTDVTAGGKSVGNHYHSDPQGGNTGQMVN